MRCNKSQKYAEKQDVGKPVRNRVNLESSIGRDILINISSR
jgi:hypothetical protein